MTKNKLILVVLFFSTACVTYSPKSARAPSGDYPVEVVGGDEGSFAYPAQKPIESEKDAPKYHVIIVGGGLGGLTAAVYLTDQKVRVLLVEKESQVGGLAAEAQKNGVLYDRGAAYWTSPYPEELKILERIELGNFQKRYPIPEPIDTYLYNGKLFGEKNGIWDAETVQQLPVSFEVFKYELQQAAADAQIPNQPFEEFKGYVDPEVGKPGVMTLDKMSAADWINSMPALLAKHDKEGRPAPEAGEASEDGKTGDGKTEEGKAGVTTKRRTASEDAVVQPRDAHAIYHRLQNDPRAMKSGDPMKPVRQFLELYCRSALGSMPENISAMAFANFYISEIETRFTTPLGTGKAARNMARILKDDKHKDFATVLPSAPVPENGISFTNQGKEVLVKYLTATNGEGQATHWTTHQAKADYVVFAAQLKFGPRLIQGFRTSRDKRTRKQAALMDKLGYSHYSVHAIEVEGHPYRASYDTWVRNADYKATDFTDIILGRWTEKPLIDGYQTSRDCSIDPDPRRNAIVTIYHPISIDSLPPRCSGRNDAGKDCPGGYDDKNSVRLAREAVSQMQQVLKPVLKCDKSIRVVGVETNRWPYSVHVARPGHYTHDARLLRRPVGGRIFFANNNLGTPAFEEALFRGHCAADNILTRMRQDFGVTPSKTPAWEEWSRCPID